MKRALTIVVGICLSIIVYVGVSASYPFDPVMDNTDKFTRHYQLTASLPFLTSYLLLVPPGYDPARKYPLVLALHGGYKRSAGAYFAAHADFQNRHQSFVLMPMALLGEPWVEPDETGKGGVRPSDSLRLAMNILHYVVADYSIDEHRLYVTGSSNGAVGTFAAVAHYKDIFAAGIPVNGGWRISDARALGSATLAIYHGERDPRNPVARMRELVGAIRGAGGRPKFVEMRGVGHDSFPACEKAELWGWLFAQRLVR
jgi:predicted peptidase